MALPTLSNPRQSISGGSGSNATILNYTPSPGADENSRLMVFASATDNLDTADAEVDSVTYDGNTVFPVTGTVAWNQTERTVYGRWFSLTNPLLLAASGDIVMTTVGATNGRAVFACTILGTDANKAANDFATAANGTDETSPYTQQITTEVADSLILSGIHIHSNNGFTLNTAGGTKHADAGGANVRQAVGSIGKPSIGAQTLSWSSVSEESAHSLIAIEPSLAGALVALDGTLAAISGQASALSVARAFNGVEAAESSLSGNLLAARPISGVQASVSELSGNLTLVGTVSVDGTLAAVSVLSGDIVSAGTVVLDGELAAISGLSGEITVPLRILTDWVDPPVAAETAWTNP